MKQTLEVKEIRDTTGNILSAGQYGYEKASRIYIVEKQFTGGWLDGLTIQEMTNVKYPIGFVCDKPVGGSPYKIISIKKA